MNIIKSKYASKEYISAVKENMSGHFEFGAERFTGFFFKNWFHVTHHAGYEWNRRYTNEKNAAVGYVKQTECGCEVHFLTFKGALVPAQFLLLLCFCPLLLLIAMAAESVTSFDLYTKIVPYSFLLIAIVAPVEALFESFTERSDEGKSVLLALLIDPKDPFSYLNNRNQLP